MQCNAMQCMYVCMLAYASMEFGPKRKIRKESRGMEWVGGYERGSIIFGLSTQIYFWVKQVKKTEKIKVITRMPRLQAHNVTRWC